MERCVVTVTPRLKLFEVSGRIRSAPMAPCALPALRLEMSVSWVLLAPESASQASMV